MYTLTCWHPRILLCTVLVGACSLLIVWKNNHGPEKHASVGDLQAPKTKAQRRTQLLILRYRKKRQYTEQYLRREITVNQLVAGFQEVHQRWPIAYLRMVRREDKEHPLVTLTRHILSHVGIVGYETGAKVETIQRAKRELEGYLHNRKISGNSATDLNSEPRPTRAKQELPPTEASRLAPPKKEVHPTPSHWAVDRFGFLPF